MKTSKEIKANANNRHQILKAQKDVRELAQHMQGMLHRLGMTIAIQNAIIEHFAIGPQVAEILGKYRDAALAMQMEQAQVDAVVNGVGIVDFSGALHGEGDRRVDLADPSVATPTEGAGPTTE